MIKIILQSMKSRRLNNILMVVQFTIGFAALLVGIGCVENVLQYKRNVESLAPLETVHISVGEFVFSDNPAAALSEYRSVFSQVQESGLADGLGLFESLSVYDSDEIGRQGFRLYELDMGCLAMTGLSLQKGTEAPLKDYDRASGIVPIVVSASLSGQYQMGERYSLFYVNGETYEYEEIQVEVAGVLEPSQRFWLGGATRLSENISRNKDFILAPQFMDFQEGITYSMNILLRLSGTRTEKETKLEQIRNIYEENQIDVQVYTLQYEVDSYYEVQKVPVIGALTFAGILLLLSLLGCIGAILAETTVRYHEFGIYYAVGMTKKDMVILMQGEILMLYCSSFLIASGSCILFWGLLLKGTSVSVNWRTILAASAVMLVCVVLCAGMPFIKLRKMEPVDMIKGGSDDLYRTQKY